MAQDAFPTDRQALLEQLSVLTSEAVPQSHALGLTLVDVVAGGEATMKLPYAPHLVGNPDTGVLHGGAVTTLIDSVCGISVLVRLGRWAPCATLDLRIDYLRPALPGQDVFARAECYKLTRAVAFVRALAHDGDPKDPVASAQGTFILTGT